MPNPQKGDVALLPGKPHKGDVAWQTPYTNFSWQSKDCWENTRNFEGYVGWQARIPSMEALTPTRGCTCCTLKADSKPKGCCWLDNPNV